MNPPTAISLHRFGLPLLLCVALSAQAQTTVIQTPNVRTEYAQVLRVEPVYQTLRAYAVEERCDPPAEAGQPGRNCRRARRGVKDPASRPRRRCRT